MKKLSTLFSLLFYALVPWVSAVRKQSSRYEIIRAIAGRFDVHVYNQLLSWHDDKEYSGMWRTFPDANAKIHERRFNLYNLSKIVIGKEGDTAECGSFRGAGSHIIMSALPSKNSHHIFDSFEGLSAPDSEDIPSHEELPLWEKGDLSFGESKLAANLAHFKGRLKLYKGWIPERFEEVESIKFRLVHIDVDLYQPTYDALEFFYSKLVEGGVIICDDYGSRTCPGATKAMDDFFMDKAEQVVHLTTGTGFIVKA